MRDDERAIRALILAWHAATARGDIEAVLDLMTDDVVFLVAGQPPMRGREAFARGLRQVLDTHRIASGGDIQEIAVSGDLVLLERTRGDDRTARRRRTDASQRQLLSVFRRGDDGRWRLARYANARCESVRLCGILSAAIAPASSAFRFRCEARPCAHP
ncbi:MAG TPA: SgcJ/EcaC family oxidoreductase [Tahibacter sp.]|uniref:YybH family protein n=1 Tax=Tahibacter sp. TaxID=2056211 RepID=UPI002C2E3C19|nr:SgcJ/EcaC family oxidoreductase [Tahibacter sp.]HSX61229.1 SgcJ/EcaC family oxidoreductase [Tahibacter sp.]